MEASEEASVEDLVVPEMVIPAEEVLVALPEAEAVAEEAVVERELSSSPSNTQEFS